MAPTTSYEQQAKKEQAVPAVAPPGPQKKIYRRSSKPIINWFQRKLAGTVKSKRVESAHKGLKSGQPLNTLRATNRVVSSPVASPVSSGFDAGRQPSLVAAAARRKTVSLNAEDEMGMSDDDDDDDSVSLAESSWSRTMEADEDASLRPIPPSAPPSPAPSRDSSSYVSDPRTFRSIAASTKPTTLLSIDLNGGMAHIAQVPTPTRLVPHLRTSSTNSGLIPNSSVSFSSLSPPPNTQRNAATNSAFSSVQAPLHTAHHPRNNPRPSSPPSDNASVLTLASSAFAFGRPVSRAGTSLLGGNSAPPSAMDSISHFGGSINYADPETSSQFVMGDDDRTDERDVDASVRALRPRSSRRGSWESEVSRWSARDVANGTPSVARERSVLTTNSMSYYNDASETSSPLEPQVLSAATVNESTPLTIGHLSPTVENISPETTVENISTPVETIVENVSSIAAIGNGSHDAAISNTDVPDVAKSDSPRGEH